MTGAVLGAWHLTVDRMNPSSAPQRDFPLDGKIDIHSDNSVVSVTKGGT